MNTVNYSNKKLGKLVICKGGTWKKYLKLKQDCLFTCEIIAFTKLGFSCICKHWKKAGYFTTWQPMKQVNHFEGLLLLHPWFKIGCKKGRNLQYITARTNRSQRSISLRKLPKHWHIVLSTGFTGLYSVLQELGFEGTMVEETIIVFLIGCRCLRWKGSTSRPQSCLSYSTCSLGLGCSHCRQKKRMWCKEGTGSSFPSSCAAAAESQWWQWGRWGG